MKAVTVQVKAHPERDWVRLSLTHKGAANKALHRAVKQVFLEEVPDIRISFLRAKGIFSERAQGHMKTWGFSITRIPVETYLSFARLGPRLGEYFPEGTDATGVKAQIRELI